MGECPPRPDVWMLGATVQNDRPTTWLSRRTSGATAIAVLLALGWSVAPPAAAVPAGQPAQFHADVPAPSLGLSEEETSDDVGVEMLLAVGPASGLDDPRHFAPLPVDTVAAVLTELDLTHEDGRPVRPRELLEDGTQLFAADGTAMVETIATGGALRALSVEPAGGGTAASWARIEDGLRRLAESLGGHLASDSEGWPEP